MKHKAAINILTSLQTIINPKTLFQHHQQIRTITKVRLKWVKNRSLDNIIDIHTDLKASIILKDAIINHPQKHLTSKQISDTQKLLGITVPTLRFMRRYPTLFHEYPHVKYANLPCFKLTNIALNLHKIEMSIYSMHEMKCVEKLCKLLMMCRSRKLKVEYVHMLRWDLGFSYDYDKVLSSKYSDLLEVVKDENGVRFFKLVKWVDEYAVSELERCNERKGVGVGEGVGEDSEFYRRFRRGENGLGFELSFPRGYGAQKKVKLWMDEFKKVPYVSPYEDSSSIDPDSELMEKRVVGVLHELLSLTVYKKTKRNYIRNLADELNIPFRFTRIFTRYPGIFYLSLKCKTTSVMLKEGYRKGKLVNPCDIAKYRGKFHYVMRTGLIYRKKGLEMLPELDKVDVDVNDVIGVHKKEDEEDGENEDDEVESSGEWVDHEDGDDDDEEFDDVSDQD